MRKSTTNFVLVVLTLIILGENSCYTNGKKYMRCELSRELVEKYQINKTFLSNWICLIEHESDRNTRKITNLPTETKYGIFQISSKECRTGNNIRRCDERMNPCCQMKCEDFINDDIADDVQCAKRLFELKGFRNWNGWTAFCRNTQNLPNLSVACNINTVTPLSRFVAYTSGNGRQYV